MRDREDSPDASLAGRQGRWVRYLILGLLVPAVFSAVFNDWWPVLKGLVAATGSIDSQVVAMVASVLIVAAGIWAFCRSSTKDFRRRVDGVGFIMMAGAVSPQLCLFVYWGITGQEARFAREMVEEPTTIVFFFTTVLFLLLFAVARLFTEASTDKMKH